jgi:RimJ/RimL family protein N-acetyltransferase
MIITLKPFTTDDLEQYAAWRKGIDASRYMSRWFPSFFNGRTVEENPFFRWYVIIYEGTDVGTVWLEREKAEEDVVRLGILLGREDIFGRGIGREAIRQAIRITQPEPGFKKVRLGVRKSNFRAIGCYKVCGFRIIDQGEKVDDQGQRIEYLTMEKVQNG